MKKTPKRMWIGALVFSLSLLAASAAHAGEGKEGGNTSGGGERVGKVLRDLVDNGTCVVRRGNAFADLNAPKVWDILNRFAETHWLFALRLNNELAQVKVCMIKGSLRGIRTNDLNDFVYYGETGATLAAIRTEDTIYIEQSAFEALNADSKAYLMIHEAMHGFIDWEAERRNHKVRNIVHAIAEVVREPMKVEDFALQIEHSQVTIPLDLAPYKPYKADLFAVFNFPRRAQSPELEDNQLRAVAKLYSIVDVCSIGKGERCLFSGNSGTPISSFEFEFIAKLGRFLHDRLWKSFESGNHAAMEHDLELGANPSLSGPYPRDSGKFLLTTLNQKDFSAFELILAADPKQAEAPGILVAAIQLNDLRFLRAMLKSPNVNVKSGKTWKEVVFFADGTIMETGAAHQAHAAIAAAETDDTLVLKMILDHPSFKAQDLKDGPMKRSIRAPNQPDQRYLYSAIDVAIERWNANMAKMLLEAGDKCLLRDCESSLRKMGLLPLTRLEKFQLGE